MREKQTKTGHTKRQNGSKTKYQLTQHAKDAMQRRKISVEWMERALLSPQLVESDEMDRSLRHRFAIISEYGGRVLHMVVNVEVAPERVVTLFFDRNRKGKL